MKTLALTTLLLGLSLPLAVAADREHDVGMFGNTPSTATWSSDETGLPESWDARDRQERQVVAAARLADLRRTGGRRRQVFVGTNNEGGRNPKLKGDRGNVMAVRRRDGRVPLAVGARQASAPGASTTGRCRASAPRPYDRGRPASTTSRTAPRSSRRHRRLSRRSQRRPGAERREHERDRRGRDLEVRHDRRARCLPAQPRRRQPADRRRPRLHGHRQRRRRRPHQHPVARWARASSRSNKNTGELVWEEPARETRSCTAPGPTRATA